MNFTWIRDSVFDIRAISILSNIMMTTIWYTPYMVNPTASVKLCSDVLKH